jgi:Cu(I)/Ag(I) efflux system membrane fusion protein
MKTTYIITLVVIVIVSSCGPKSQHENDSKPAQATATEIPEFKDVDPDIKGQLDNVLVDYFALNEAFINDNYEGAMTAAGNLASTVKEFKISKLTNEQMDFYYIQSSNMKSGLQEIGSSSDIEKARTGLATVSKAMYAFAKAFHPSESPLYYQYCPMALNNEGANWLSTTEKLMNPYMGQMMLNCGKTQEKLN